MLSKLSVLLFFWALLDFSRSIEVHQPVQKIEEVLVHKFFLPRVEYLLEENSDGNRQKFLHLLDGLEIGGYKFVNGEFWEFPRNSSIKLRNSESSNTSYRS